MSASRAAFAFLFVVAATGCAGSGSGPLDLDGTWLASMHVETQSDAGDHMVEENPQFELVIDQVGEAVSFAGILGFVRGDRIVFGSKRVGSSSEDGDWTRGWWQVRADGWAERGEAEITMRIEVWDSGGTEIVGLDQRFHFTDFVKLDEPKRVTYPASELE